MQKAHSLRVEKASHERMQKAHSLWVEKEFRQEILSLRQENAKNAFSAYQKYDRIVVSETGRRVFPPADFRERSG